MEGYVEIDGMGVAKPTRDRAPVEILAVGLREGRMQARAFWDDRRTIRTGITVRENEYSSTLKTGGSTASTCSPGIDPKRECRVEVG